MRKTVTELAMPEQGQRLIRLAPYTRVSSGSDDQLHSFAAQVKYYTEYAAAHPEYELVDIYADEAVTGTRMDKRDDLNRLLRDCRKGKIDRIITKSVSRFARNTTELLTITDRLNDLLADPEQVHYTPATHESPVELLRLKNEIGRMLDGTMIDKDLLKNKIFEYASRQYAELDAGERITMEMRVALLDTGPLSSYSAELVKAIVTDITLHADKSVTLTLKNGQQVRKEQSDGAHEHSA